MPVTMREVAQEAGVSIKTVSRVVNEQGEIREETRNRVLTAIEKLGYRPSKVARALVTSRTDTIGLLVGDIQNPYFSEVARGVLDIAQECSYDIFLGNTDGIPQTEKRAIYSLIDHNIDGAIIYPTWKNKDWIPRFAQLNCPLVLVNSRTEPRVGIGLVRTKIREGAVRAVRYLIKKGHRKIGMIAGEVSPIERINRVCGYREALECSGLQFREDWVFLGDPVMEHGAAATKEMLESFSEITAIFCYNDLLAMGAMQSCKEMGLKIPGDVAIIGFDNIRFSALIDPPLTSVHVDKYEIGRRSAALLLKMLEEPEQEYPVEYIDTDLVVRDSA